MSRRFQFSLKTFLVAILIVATFFGGMALQKHLDDHIGVTAVEVEKGTAVGRVYRDGSVRVHFHPGPPTGPMRSPQFSIPPMLWLTLFLAVFLAGIGLGRKRRIRENAASVLIPPPNPPGS